MRQLSDVWPLPGQRPNIMVAAVGAVKRRPRNRSCATKSSTLSPPRSFTPARGNCQVNRTRKRCLRTRLRFVAGHTLYTRLTKPRVVRHSPRAESTVNKTQKNIYQTRSPAREILAGCRSLPVSLALRAALFNPLYKALYRGNMPGTQCGFLMYREKKRGLKEQKGAKSQPCGTPVCEHYLRPCFTQVVHSHHKRSKPNHP